MKFKKPMSSACFEAGRLYVHKIELASTRISIIRINKNISIPSENEPPNNLK